MKSSGRSASAWVALGILLSRVAGLVRDRVFAHYLGNSDAAGAFKAAFRIPNFLQNLFGEGVLSASFIPVYSKLSHEEDRELARKTAGVVGAVLSLWVSLLVLIGVWATPVLVDLVAPGFHGELRELTVHLVRILFPGAGLLVVSAWCLGILNSHGKFFLSYAAPVVWNLAMIVALFWYGRSSRQDELAIVMAWASVVGSALQLGIQLPFVFQSAGRLKFGINLKIEPVREVFRNLGPVLIGRGVVQLSAYIDAMIASFLGASAVASLAYAQTLYLLPISLFGMSIAAAELPAMSKTGNDAAGFEKLRSRLVMGRRKIAFFVIPSALAFLFLGRDVIAALYQTGQFGPQDTLYVWYVLMGSVVGLLASTWGRLYSSSFYALRDTKTPLRFALIRVALTIVLGLLFAFPLRPLIVQFFTLMPGLGLPQVANIELGLGAVGLTASAGMAGWIEFLLMKSKLEKKVGTTTMPAGLVGRIWTAGLISAVLGLIFEKWFFSVPAFDAGLRAFHYDLRPLFVLGFFGCLYLILTTLLKVEEAKFMTGKFTRLLK